MREQIDTAHRSFAALVTLGAVPFTLVGIFSCGLLTAIGYRVARQGVGALSAGPGDLRPAVLAFTVVAIGMLIAGYSAWQQVSATRRLARRIRSGRAPVPASLASVAVDAGLVHRLDYVTSDLPYSFAYGTLRPRVVVSSALVDRLPPPALHAVLEHERYHVHHLDPLKVMVTRVLAAGAFFLPALRGLQARYGATSELAADRRAIAACGRGPLAAALHETVRGPAWEELATAAAIGGPELLDVRIAQLETGHEPRVASASRGSLALTALALVALGAAFMAAVANVGLHHLIDGSTGSGTGMSMRWGLHDLWWSIPLVAWTAAGLRRCRSARPSPRP